MENTNQAKSPLKAIRHKCLDCCCGNPNEVRECQLTTCELHPFRFGKNPFRTPMSEERRAKLREQARIYGFKKGGSDRENSSN